MNIKLIMKLVFLGLFFSLCACKPLQKASSFLIEDNLFQQHVHSKVKGCPPQPVPQQLPSDLPEGISKSIDALSNLGKQSVDSTAVPGIVMGLTYMGKTIWTKGFGVIAKNNPKLGPPNETTIFRIGSVSKVFSVLMVYQLLMNNKIDSLDDPFTKYSPDFKIHDPFSRDGRGNITIRQMASQLSGLQREAPCVNRTTENVCPQSTEEILKLLSSEMLIRPPLIQPSYSNLTYALLGRLLVDEYLKQITFEDYVKEKILDPLKLADTGFSFTNEVKSKMAVGYNGDGSEASLVNLGWLAPAGQMYSSIKDLNKLSEFFYQAHLLPKNDLPEDENVLSSVLRREMSLPLFVNPDRETGFGTPWEIMYRYNYTIRTKGGNVNGYSALFSFIPELHLGFNAVFSGSFDEFSFAETAYGIIIPPFVEYLSQNQPGVGFPPNPDAYVGNYTYGILVLAKSNSIYINYQGETFYLDFKEKNIMQIYYPEYLLPCMTNALSADEGEWVYFDPNYKSGKSPGFTIPGLFFDIYFARVN